MTTSEVARPQSRPLGAFERTIDLYMHRNPVQFSLVAELATPCTAGALAGALTALQRRHPMLAVRIDRTTPVPGFAPAPGAVPVTTVAAGTPWQAVVAGEQQSPLRSDHGPLLRATLVPGEERSTLVLTFAHQIADGIGGSQALVDLVGLLTGPEDPGTGRLPAAMEDAVGDAPTEADPAPGEDASEEGAPAADPRMATPGRLAEFEGQLPHVSWLALEEALTTRLVQRCRAEGVTVHTALCAAATVELHRRGRDFVRVLSPVDLRRGLGLPAEVAVRFGGARTGTPADHAGGLWDVARRTHRDLRTQRSPRGLRAGVAALGAQPPISPEQAEAMMAASNAADLQITNLGALTAPPTVTAIWGPAQLTQLADEHVVGVATTHGRLRLTELTHQPVPVLLPAVAATLAQACE